MKGGVPLTPIRLGTLHTEISFCDVATFRSRLNE